MGKPCRERRNARAESHHDIGTDQLAPLVAFAVQPGEDVEAAVELRLGAVDHRVGDGGPGGPAALVEALGDRDVRGVERVAQLHGLVLPGSLDVRIEATDGFVQEACTTAASKTTASFAKASSSGVVGRA